MRAVAGRGRWIWGVSGLVTAAVLAVSGARLIGAGGFSRHVQPQATVTRTVTVTQPVTGLTVQSYGAPVQVTTGSTRRVQVTETLAYDRQAGGPPPVTQSVSGGHLLLADPACSVSDCTVSFALTAPPGVTVTVMTDGGPLTVAGTAGANLDSGGGPVRAARIGGPLTVSTGGGQLQLNGLAGALHADTDGGPLTAQGVDAAAATVSTGGGDAQIAFAAAPDTVTVSTDGGLAAVNVPGGPYALAADSGGGPESVRIATDPAAPRSITVSSGGGPLQIGPPAVGPAT
jgi:hypothetical protein